MIKMIDDDGDRHDIMMYDHVVIMMKYSNHYSKLRAHKTLSKASFHNRIGQNSLFRASRVVLSLPVLAVERQNEIIAYPPAFVCFAIF